MKRSLDLLGATVGLLLLAPVFLVVAALIKADDSGPVFFRQVRIGRSGRHFRLLKFRTMVANAEGSGASVTVDGDDRITRTGRFLRQSKLDELPQLINVLAGQMSLVGPRPEVPKYVDLYDHKQREVLRFLPGMTDPASIAFCNEGALLYRAGGSERFYIEQIIPTKLSLSLEYAARATSLTDLLVLFRTLRHLIMRSKRTNRTLPCSASAIDRRTLMLGQGEK